MKITANTVPTTGHIYYIASNATGRVYVGSTTSYREIERMTGRSRHVIGRECKKVKS